MTNQHRSDKLHHFTAIQKSSPVASWDSKVSLVWTLQNLQK